MTSPWGLVRGNKSRFGHCSYQSECADHRLHERHWVSVYYVLRSGSASVELEGTTSRAVIATLRAGDVFGEMAFLGDSTATAAVVATDEVDVDAIWANDLRELVTMFPGFGARFYRSLAVILAQRLRETSRELLREMTKKR